MKFLGEAHPFRQVWERCESPIEQILCTAMFVDLGMTTVPDGYSLRDFVTDKPRAFLFSQYRIAGYRVDFLVIVADRKTRIPFVIECDGKRYHSSEEQQAYDEQRDTALRQAVIRDVYRFTGSEIVKAISVVIPWIADRLRECGAETTPPDDFADYRMFRDALSTENRARRDIEDQVDNEEELAAIRRADAMWL